MVEYWEKQAQNFKNLLLQNGIKIQHMREVLIDNELLISIIKKSGDTEFISKSERDFKVIILTLLSDIKIEIEEYWENQARNLKNLLLKNGIDIQKMKDVLINNDLLLTIIQNSGDSDFISKSENDLKTIILTLIIQLESKEK